MSKILSQDKNVIKFNLEIDKAVFSSAIEKAYQKNKGKFRIQGFRKGKATKSMIEKLYGDGVFYDDAIDIVFPEAYSNAIKELGVEVIDRPAIDEIVSIGKDKDLIIRVEVQIKPEIKLQQYKGLEITKVEEEVTDEDIMHEIDIMRDKNARLVTVEDRPVKDKDIILLDFLGKVDGVAFDGGKAENYELVVGSNTFIPGFEEQLIGLSIGEEKDINVTFPEEYHSENLKGKPAVFTVKVNEIKEKQVPELDDDFVSEASEFETLEELKNDLKSKMQERKRTFAVNTMKNEIVAKVADSAEVEIPNVMIDTEIDAMIRDFEQNLRYQGMDLKTYFKYTESTVESLREQMKEDAEKRVKMALAVEEIAKLENIVATEDDLEEEYKKLAEMYKMEVEQIKNIFGKSSLGIEKTIISRKTTDFLIENSKLV